MLPLLHWIEQTMLNLCRCCLLHRADMLSFLCSCMNDHLCSVQLPFIGHVSVEGAVCGSLVTLLCQPVVSVRVPNVAMDC